MLPEEIILEIYSYHATCSQCSKHLPYTQKDLKDKHLICKLCKKILCKKCNLEEYGIRKKYFEAWINLCLDCRNKIDSKLA